MLVSNVTLAIPTLALLTILPLTFLGFGRPPVVVALAVFAVPPLLANAYTGRARRSTRRPGTRPGGWGCPAGRCCAGWSCRWRCRTSRPGSGPRPCRWWRPPRWRRSSTAAASARSSAPASASDIAAGGGQIVAGGLLVAGLALLAEVVLALVERLVTPAPAAARPRRRRPTADAAERLSPVPRAVASTPFARRIRSVTIR